MKDLQDGALEAKPAKPKKPKQPTMINTNIDVRESARRLREGSALVAAMARDIENENGDLEAMMIERFKAMLLNTSEGVDIALSGLNELRGNINKALTHAAIFSDAASKMQRALDAAEETIKRTIVENPDIPYKGDFGEFKVINNGGLLPLELLAGVSTKTLHISDTIDSATVFEFDIPGEYIEKISIETLKLRKDLIRADLESGKKLDFANLAGRGRRLKYPSIKIEAQSIKPISKNYIPEIGEENV